MVWILIDPFFCPNGSELRTANGSESKWICAVLREKEECLRFASTYTQTYPLSNSDKMNTVETTLRQQLAAICADLEIKYPGCSEEILGRFFGTLSVPVLPPMPANGEEKKQKKVRAKKAKTEEVVPVGTAVEKEEDKASVKTSSVDGRKRVVSKKMGEAFLALATSLNKENAETLLEGAKVAYKALTDEDLQQKGGEFTTWMHFFLTGAAPAPKEKKVRAKKEKAPSRIDRWTPTLTRTLTKIVEDNGGKMDDKHKKAFHAWVDDLAEETFKGAELAGHMRTWVSTTLVGTAPVATTPAAAHALLAEEDEEEVDEDLEDLEHDGETLSIGVTTGKIFRSTPAGDIWIGNAGVGRFSAVKRPE